MKQQEMKEKHRKKERKKLARKRKTQRMKNGNKGLKTQAVVRHGLGGLEQVSLDAKYFTHYNLFE
mgnify:CR=1 FL=1